MTSVELAPMFEAVATGQADATVSAWLPNTHDIIYGNVADDLVDLGPHLEGNRPGLVVPTYMEVNSIEDLTDEAGKVITGQEPGAGQTKMVYQALEDYPNLGDWEQHPSSSGAMFSVLADAYPKQEEIIISGWSPHWSFIEYDLKFLEDPRSTFGEGEFIHTLVRYGLEADMPEAYRILNNFNWEVEDLEYIMFDIHNGEDPQTAAKKWIEANPAKVSSWIAE